MALVYRKTLCVLVWLGEEEVNSAIAIDFFEKLVSEPTLHLSAEQVPRLQVRGMDLDFWEPFEPVVRLLS
jgi:hypothetical protein